MLTKRDDVLTREQKKQIDRVVKRYLRIQRKKFIRELYIWKKFHKN